MATGSGARQAIWISAMCAAILAPVVVGPTWGMIVAGALVTFAIVVMPRK